MTRSKPVSPATSWARRGGEPDHGGLVGEAAHGPAGGLVAEHDRAGTAQGLDLHDRAPARGVEADVDLLAAERAGDGVGEDDDEGFAEGLLGDAAAYLVRGVGADERREAGCRAPRRAGRRSSTRSWPTPRPPRGSPGRRRAAHRGAGSRRGCGSARPRSRPDRRHRKRACARRRRWRPWILPRGTCRLPSAGRRRQHYLGRGASAGVELFTSRGGGRPGPCPA